jgi:hypothetical protein
MIIVGAGYAEATTQRQKRCLWQPFLLKSDIMLLLVADQQLAFIAGSSLRVTVSRFLQ